MLQNFPCPETFLVALLKPLFYMHSQRLKIYKEMSLLLRPNYYFFLASHFGEKYCISCIKGQIRLYTHKFIVRRQFFSNNSFRIYPVKLKIGVLCQINNIFQNTVFKISVAMRLTKSS